MAPELSRADALDALNQIALTPTAEEVLEPYRQAFRLSPQAHATIEALSKTSRRAHLNDHTQQELARRAGVTQSTVSDVVERLRRLGLVETAGGEYVGHGRRRTVLRYRFRWGPAMWLGEDRWQHARLAAAALAAEVAPSTIRTLVEAGARGRRELLELIAGDTAPKKSL